MGFLDFGITLKEGKKWKRILGPREMFILSGLLLVLSLAVKGDMQIIGIGDSYDTPFDAMPVIGHVVLVLALVAVAILVNVFFIFAAAIMLMVLDDTSRQNAKVRNAVLKGSNYGKKN